MSNHVCPTCHGAGVLWEEVLAELTERLGLRAEDDRLALSRQEAARMLSISVDLLDELIDRGEITARTIGARKVVIPRESLLAFLRDTSQGAVPWKPKTATVTQLVSDTIGTRRGCSMTASKRYRRYSTQNSILKRSGRQRAAHWRFVSPRRSMIPPYCCAAVESGTAA